MNTKTIKIGGQTLEIKQTMRAFIEFEKMAGKPAHEINASVTDSMQYCYCMLKTSNKKEFTMSFDEFLDYTDEHPEVFTAFTDFTLEKAETVASVIQ